jgi:hypothetical protein
MPDLRGAMQTCRASVNRRFLRSFAVALSLVAALASVTASTARAQDAASPAASSEPAAAVDGSAPAASEAAAPDAAAPTAALVPAPAQLVTAAPPVAPAAEEDEEDAHPALRAEYIVGEGVALRAADNSFSLVTKGRLQLRGTFADAAGDDDAASSEIQARRIRLAFNGHFLVPELTYYLQLGFANRDTESDLRLPLRDAWFQYAAHRDLTIRVGQGKVPFNRQRMVSSSALQFADRSIVQDELTLDRDVGVSLLSKDLFGLGGWVQYHLGMFGGDGRNRLSSRSGMLWVARLEISPFGSFDSYVESDLSRDSRPRLQVAFSAAINKNTVRERSTIGATYQIGGFDYHHLGADLIFKWAGLSVQAEWLWRDAPVRSLSEVADDGSTNTEYARPGWGYFVQAGYLTPFGIEVAGRYGDLRPRAGGDPEFARARELGGVLGWYVAGHALKVQADYFYLFGDSFEGGRHQARVQAQLQF